MDKTKIKPRTNKADRERMDEQFISAMGAGASPEEAALALGYAPSCAESMGHRLRNRLHDRIVDAQIKRLQSHSIKAINQIYKLAMSASQESVKLKSCQDILDRAGLKATTRIEQTTTVNALDQVSTEDLEKELASLLKGTPLAEEGLENVILMPGVTEEDATFEYPPGFGQDTEIDDDDDEEETR